jgi:hypothetical protein
MAATSVTLGATILLCRENDTQVQVPLFRRGRDTELTEVEVTTEDGSAKLGEHYLPIVTTNGGKLEEVGRPVTTVSFEPGAQVTGRHCHHHRHLHLTSSHHPLFRTTSRWWRCHCATRARTTRRSRSRCG